jgi:hypothetical protein
MLKSLAGSLLFFAFVSATYAGEVRLGVERPLTPIGPLGPAASIQFSPTVASNGRDFLALWVDARRGANYDLYAARIGRDGMPGDSKRIPRDGSAWTTQIASAGTDYLIAYPAGTGTITQRLDENGTPISPRRVIPDVHALSLVSNGATYLLITEMGNTDYHESAILLDREGVPIRTLWSTTDHSVAAGAHYGRYVIVDSSLSAAGATRPMLHTFDESGAVTDTPFPEIKNDVQLVAAFSRDAILVGWQRRYDGKPGNISGYLLVDYSGRLQTAVDLDDANRANSAKPIAWWDGTDFGVIFGNDYAFETTEVLRISATGKRLGSNVLTRRAPGGLDHPVFASASATAHIVLWSGWDFSKDLDIEACTFSSFASIGRSDRNLISYSGEPQINVRVARAGTHEIVVRAHGTNFLASVDGVTLPIPLREPQDYAGPPAVAAGKESFLVVWSEYLASISNIQLLAVRITFDGRLIDAIPIVLWSGKDEGVGLESANIASDGTTFLITWAQRDVLMARLPEDRSIRTVTLTTFPVNAVSPGSWWSTAHAPQVAWTGNGFFAGYSVDRVPYWDGYYHDTAMVGLPIDANRDPPAPTAYLFYTVANRELPLGMAAGAGTAMFVWSVNRLIPGIAMGRVVAGEAKPWGMIAYTPLENFPPSELCARNAPAIAWNGSEFVVAWAEGSDEWCVSASVRAIRLDPNGELLDKEPFDVVTDVRPVIPSIVPTAEGVDIIYSRNDEDNGEAPRAFARSLARLSPLLLRRHAVR